jgi:hypothetical protein
MSIARCYPCSGGADCLADEADAWPCGYRRVSVYAVADISASSGVYWCAAVDENRRHCFAVAL